MQIQMVEHHSKFGEHQVHFWKYPLRNTKGELTNLEALGYQLSSMGPELAPYPYLIIIFSIHNFRIKRYNPKISFVLGNSLILFYTFESTMTPALFSGRGSYFGCRISIPNFYRPRTHHLCRKEQNTSLNIRYKQAIQQGIKLMNFFLYTFYSLSKIDTNAYVSIFQTLLDILLLHL